MWVAGRGREPVLILKKNLRLAAAKRGWAGGTVRAFVMSVNNSEEGRPLLEPDLRSSNDLPSIRKPISPAPGTALSNRWRYYQYLNIDLKNVPRLAASHVLTYDEDADDDAHFGGGENILHPVALSKDDYGCVLGLR